jgi:Fe-S-cluster containining protein
MSEQECYIDHEHPLVEEDSFCFSCTPEKECFTACCYDVNLVLMPYDVVRLKRRLNMRSDEFLKRYTSVHVGQGSGVPVLTMNMERNSFRCLFLEEGKGCSVYEDRPGACRTYPLARMIHRSVNDQITVRHYVVREPDCKGFEAGVRRSVKEWIEHEGIAPYNAMNDIFSELLQAKNEAGVSVLNADQIETFYLGCYNIDAFRDFFLNGPNLDRYMEDPQVIERISQNEDTLLEYAMRWVKKKLFSGCSCVGCKAF